MEKTIQGGDVITLSAPFKGGWVAAIVRSSPGHRLELIR
jgi:hypothetical protein